MFIESRTDSDWSQLSMNDDDDGDNDDDSEDDFDDADNDDDSDDNDDDNDDDFDDSWLNRCCICSCRSSRCRSSSAVMR